MGTLIRDLRFALRMVRKSPGFSVTVILLLGLGIGATTAVYSVVSAVLLRPLPYVESDRIINIWETDPPMMHGTASAPNYLDWKRQSTVFESMAAFTYGELNLAGEGDPERLVALRVSPDFFGLLGARPRLGRSFAPDEARAGRDNVVILSHGLWKRRYGGDPDIVGRTIELSGRRSEVVGVMPEGFRTPLSIIEPTVWVPLVLGKTALAHRDAHYLFVLARLKRSRTVAAARSEMGAIARALGRLYPDTNRTRGVGLERIQELMVEDVRPALLVLLAAVALVLLIACANIASLLLVRATEREPEVAIRLALGASRPALVRQFVVENALLSLMGGAVGLLLALWITDLLVAGLPDSLRLMTEIGVDAKVAAFALALSLLVSLVFGLVPAIHAAGGEVSAALREAGSRASASRRRNRVRDVLVVAEIALCLTLTVGATLLARSYRNLRGTQLGFDPEHVVTMAIARPRTTGVYESDPTFDPDRTRSFFARLIARVDALPGVESVGLINYLPLTHANINGDFAIEGRPWRGSGRPVTEYLTASPGFFEAMGMPLRAGRRFTTADVASSRPVAVVNETMARRFFSGESPIGKRMKIEWAGDVWREIVGVVADVRRRSPGRPPSPETYVPFAQRPVSSVSLVVRGRGDPLPLVPSVRRAVAALDSAQAVAAVRTLEHVVDDSVARQRFSTVLLGLFAAAALFLAIIGVYGVVSYQVSQRTHEIGVRVALGARESDIWKLVVGAGARLAALGVAVGLVATLGASRLVRSLLYGVGPTDPATYAAVALLVTGVALLASYLPARRAARIDPMLALRIE
jgi:putative ABC transport system permease protein